MHSLCAIVAFTVTLVLIDLPLKIISIVIFLLFALIGCIIYPLIKNITFPNWICDWYEYTTEWWIAIKVWNTWQR